MKGVIARCNAAERLAQAGGRFGYRRKRPRGRGLDEHLLAVGQLRDNGAARVDAALRAVEVDETDTHVADQVFETPQGRGEPPLRVSAQLRCQLRLDVIHGGVDGMCPWSPPARLRSKLRSVSQRLQVLDQVSLLARREIQSE